MSTLAERQRHDGIEADTDATPRRALRILIFEYAVCLQIAIVSMSARNAGVTVSIEGPVRLHWGHERGQGCRVRGSACAAGRRVVRAALASTGADARSAQSCTRRCVRTLRRGSRGRARRARTTIRSRSGSRRSSAGT